MWFFNWINDCFEVFFGRLHVLSETKTFQFIIGALMLLSLVLTFFYFLGYPAHALRVYLTAAAPELEHVVAAAEETELVDTVSLSVIIHMKVDTVSGEVAFCGNKLPRIGERVFVYESAYLDRPIAFTSKVNAIKFCALLMQIDSRHPLPWVNNVVFGGVASVAVCFVVYELVRRVRLVILGFRESVSFHRDSLRRELETAGQQTPDPSMHSVGFRIEVLVRSLTETSATVMFFLLLLVVGYVLFESIGLLSLGADFFYGAFITGMAIAVFSVVAVNPYLDRFLVFRREQSQQPIPHTVFQLGKLTITLWGLSKLCITVTRFFMSTVDRQAGVLELLESLITELIA